MNPLARAWPTSATALFSGPRRVSGQLVPDAKTCAWHLAGRSARILLFRGSSARPQRHDIDAMLGSTVVTAKVCMVFGSAPCSVSAHGFCTVGSLGKGLACGGRARRVLWHMCVACKTGGLMPALVFAGVESSPVKGSRGSLTPRGGHWAVLPIGLQHRLICPVTRRVFSVASWAVRDHPGQMTGETSIKWVAKGCGTAYKSSSCMGSSTVSAIRFSRTTSKHLSKADTISSGVGMAHRKTICRDRRRMDSSRALRTSPSCPPPCWQTCASPIATPSAWLLVGLLRGRGATRSPEPVVPQLNVRPSFLHLCTHASSTSWVMSEQT